MTVEELFQLTKWIDVHVRNPRLPKRYSALQEALNRYAHPGEQGRSFDAEKQQLIEAVKAASVDTLTHSQLEFLSALQITPYVGAEGVRHIEDLLFRNVIDVATSANAFGDIVVKLNDGLNKAEGIRNGLQGCVTERAADSTDEVIIRITFKKGASLGNLSDLREWGKVWFEIGRGVAMAHGGAPEDVRIIAASHGSIVVDLATVAAIASTVSFIIMRGLAIAERVLNLQIKAEELRGMRLKNDQLALSLLEAAKVEKTAGVESIAGEAAKELGLTKSRDGEKIAALTKAIAELLDFVEKGGEVDFVLPELPADHEKADQKDMKKLRSNYVEMRQLELKLALLEAPKS